MIYSTKMETPLVRMASPNRHYFTVSSFRVIPVCKRASLTIAPNYSGRFSIVIHEPFVLGCGVRGVRRDAGGVSKVYKG
jgi:hypothetical protein